MGWRKCAMNKSCWSCKHCINDYFATGTMDCIKQDDMTEEEFERKLEVLS